MVNICIVYEISKNCNISSYPTLENCMFGAVSSTKNNDIDQYKYFTQRINGTAIYAEKLYSINFAENNKTFCLSLYYNGANSYLFVAINLKQKTLRLWQLHYV